MKIKIPTKIEVKSSQIHGLGVFATDFIKKGEIIEQCPVITITKIEATISLILHRYRFLYPVSNPEEHCIPLGYGCIYNHNDDNNATWIDGGYRLFNFIAIRDIQPGEEICTKYGGSEYWNHQEKIAKLSPSIFDSIKKK